jgi:nitroimidazol reductase NimA-like FMN-containing flavoprotein (pyridoxamine 5'-phosphate oxidase superfamily)
MNESMDLTLEECLDLMNGGVIGRVALATPVGPRIIPINYAMDGTDVIFRTAPYSELGTYGWNNQIAFEVDHLDYEHHQGWSVVATGRMTVVDDPDEVDRIRHAWNPRPWVGGSRNMYLRLAWSSLTGRRIGRDWSRCAMMPVRRAL